MFAVGACLLCGTFAANHRRALDDRITHFEPLDIRQDHVFRRRRTYDGPDDDRRHTGEFTMSLTAFGENMTLHLRPADHLFEEGAVLETLTDGVPSYEPLSAHGYYSGHATGVVSKFVHIAVAPDGAVRGMIELGGTGEEALHIDPARDHFDGDPGFNHVIYRESDIDWVKPDPAAGPTCQADRAELLNRIPAPAENQPAADASSTRERRATCGTAGAGVKSSDYVNGCNRCHIALYAGQDFVQNVGDGSESKTIQIMIKRFSFANEIFKATQFTPGTAEPILVDLRILKITISKDTLTGETASDLLEEFSKQQGDRDFSTYCLAHLFTYQDYQGILGLAWTAYVDSKNHNGGICQGTYNKASGQAVSLNTAFTSTLNFGSKQPELQTMIVFVHELGHNFGSPHDPGSGVNIMNKYATSGKEPGNEEFSSASVSSISAVLKDRAGCFLQSTGNTSYCGDFVREGAEQCDCGDSAETCAVIDKCCNPYADDDTKCKFTPTADCSPLDLENGGCCTAECGAQPLGHICQSQSVCQAPRKCQTGDGSSSGKATICSKEENLEEYSICEVGVEKCEAGQCGSLCDSDGKCSLSICALWGLESANIAGENACQIRCMKNGAPTSTSGLGATTMAGYDADNKTIPAGSDSSNEHLGIDVKKKGAKCQFVQGDFSSGICDNDGVCLPADTEEDSLDELYKQYEQFKSTFLDWANEDTSGLKNYGWLIIGGVLLLLCCCGTCYCTNKEKEKRMGDMPDNTPVQRV